MDQQLFHLKREHWTHWQLPVKMMLIWTCVMCARVKNRLCICVRGRVGVKVRKEKLIGWDVINAQSGFIAFVWAQTSQRCQIVQMQLLLMLTVCYLYEINYLLFYFFNIVVINSFITNIPQCILYNATRKTWKIIHHIDHNSLTNTK